MATTLTDCTCTCQEAVEKVVQLPASTSEKISIMIVTMLIVLVIIALIIGFKKLRDKGNEDDTESNTYY